MSKFLEIERKYKADTVDKKTFIDLCKSLDPYKYVYAEGPDTYYDDGERVLRWRRSSDLNQITIKSRLTKRSSLIREELEVDLSTLDAKQIISFVKALGFEKVFRIRKSCDIFWFKTDLGEVSVVYYTVTSKGKPNRAFIEIEAEKGQSMSSSKELIRFWEEKLGLKEHWRLNKTLLELYSDLETRLLADDELYCSNCLEKKNIDSFYSRALGASLDVCKPCLSELELSEQQKLKRKEYRDNRKEARQLYDKVYRQLNKDKIRERNKIYNADRRVKDIEFKLAANLRTRLYLAISEEKGGSAIKDLGCSVVELKAHLESKFYNNPKTNEPMTWDNWGKGTGKWQIDHIIPLASVNLSDPKDFKKVSHFTNLQPLWAEDHVSKTIKDLERTS